MRQQTRRNNKKHKRSRRNGGAATVFPLKYFDISAETPSASAGRDLLQASGLGVRPRIGGKRTTYKNKRTKGGFIPSVMDGFVAAASKYIVPIALFAGYKLMTKKGKKRSNRYTRRR